jgi:hypothetical protein
VIAYRQWVLAYPRRLRLAFAHHPRSGARRQRLRERGCLDHLPGQFALPLQRPPTTRPESEDALAAPTLDDILAERFGFRAFRSGQREVLGVLREHKAALAVFPTGAGKSLCYQLPALALPGLTLVVSPLIALMNDQLDFLASRGIGAARLDSSLPEEQSRRVVEQVRKGELNCSSWPRSASTTSASWRCCASAASRSSRWMRRTASPSGATASAPTISSSRSWPGS